MRGSDGADPARLVVGRDIGSEGVLVLVVSLKQMQLLLQRLTQS